MLSSFSLSPFVAYFTVFNFRKFGLFAGLQPLAIHSSIRASRNLTNLRPERTMQSSGMRRSSGHLLCIRRITHDSLSPNFSPTCFAVISFTINFLCGSRKIDCLLGDRPACCCSPLQRRAAHFFFCALAVRALPDAIPALRADSRRWVAVNLAARALPPNLPNCCAALFAIGGPSVTCRYVQPDGIGFRPVRQRLSC